VGVGWGRATGAFCPGPHLVRSPREGPIALSSGISKPGLNWCPGKTVILVKDFE